MSFEDAVEPRLITDAVALFRGEALFAAAQVAHVEQCFVFGGLVVEPANGDSGRLQRAARMLGGAKEFVDPALTGGPVWRGTGDGWPTRVAARARRRAAKGMSGPRMPWGPPLPSHRSYWWRTVRAAPPRPLSRVRTLAESTAEAGSGRMSTVPPDERG